MLSEGQAFYDYQTNSLLDGMSYSPPGQALLQMRKLLTRMETTTTTEAR